MNATLYRAPGSGQTLRQVGDALVAADGARFPLRNGMPDFSWPQSEVAPERAIAAFYDARADVYDRYLPLTFATFGEDEAAVRDAMVDRLRLVPNARVLEVGAGTGRDSEVIARRLGDAGVLFCQDIAAGMLALARDRLADAGLRAEFAIAGASHLPFADRSLDAVFQFGGIGEFPDVAAFFQEAVRVTRVGGRIVVGDESMPPWLRATEFARVLTHTNPQFAAPLPLAHLPIEARDVHLRWIIGGTFYLLDFTVGEGEPPADFDFPIPGIRGGTHRTRTVGQLEGVTPEAKLLAQRAREKLGISMHDWLDALVRREAARVLDGNPPCG